MRLRPAFPIALALTSALLAACSRPPEAPAVETAAPSARTKARTPPPVAEAIEPCSLLTDAELRAVLPAAGPGAPDTADAHAGIQGCQWKTPAGRVWIQVYPGGPSVPDLEIRTIATGMFDPTKPEALTSMRIESLPKLGKGAFAYAEPVDAKRGVVAPNAVLVQSGRGNIVVLFAPELVAQGRKDALTALGRLGANIKTRL